MPRVTSISPEALAELQRWLRSHHDVVSVSELAALRLPRHYASSRVRAGRWQRWHEGVFVAHAGPVTYATRCAAALAALGPDAALDADTAASFCGVVSTDLELTDVHVVVPRRAPRRSLDRVRVRRSMDATARAMVVRKGLRVLRLERALVVIAHRRPRGARGLLASAVQEGLTTADRLRGAVLASGARVRRRTLLTVLADIEGGTRTELEGRFLDGARLGRLPTARRNHPLVIDGRRLWLDLAYPELLIAIEIDGKAFHVLAEDWEDDLDRQNAIMLAGWLVLRFTARAIRDDPEGCVERVRRAIELRSKSLAQARSL
jgi:very-short-patch-repair endonuclease